MSVKATNDSPTIAQSALAGSAADAAPTPASARPANATPSMQTATVDGASKFERKFIVRAKVLDLVKAHGFETDSLEKPSATAYRVAGFIVDGHLRNDLRSLFRPSLAGELGNIYKREQKDAQKRANEAALLGLAFFGLGGFIAGGLAQDAVPPKAARAEYNDRARKELVSAAVQLITTVSPVPKDIKFPSYFLVKRELAEAGVDV